MSEAVLDSSALLAVLFREAGADKVLPYLHEARMSAVNVSEVTAKMVDRGVPLEKAVEIIARQPLKVMSFDAEQAYVAASLRPATRGLGLSLGDRACLSLAIRTSLPAVTADSNWLRCSIGVKVLGIR